MKTFVDYANDIKDEVIANRRYLHQNPELGDDLPVTTAFVKSKLEEIGLTCQEISKCGLVSTIEGAHPGKTILLRADMDALPMNELCDLDFKSQTNYAHTCGHDLHTATLLGAAKILVGMKDQLHGNVKLMFQPAEEAITGSQAMLDGGLLENPKVDAGVDMHVMTDMPVGTIGCKTGYSSSSSDIFKITVDGKECHGAQPQNGIDPINVAAHIHIALQEIIAREIPAAETVVITIGQFHAGTAGNIIPGEATMNGTIRCYNEELRAKILKRVNEIVDFTAKAFGTSAKFEVLSETPAIYADPEMMDLAKECLTTLGTDITLNEEYILTASDDYARVAKLVPSAFLLIGAAPAEKEKVFPNHNANVIFNEDCLVIGTALFAKIAYEFLNKNK
ncbi:MAG: amidohydrolase [Clostridioides sp.]|jgi:amidohydrolase|nr:amidohydrolase [Clostridioides sp.]